MELSVKEACPVDQASRLRELLAEQRQPRSRVRVVAVTSGKGGVGKTSVAANLAVLAATMGKRVLVIDSDLGLANIEIVCGLTPRYHLGHLLDGSAALRDVLIRGPRGISVLSANSGEQSLTTLTPAQKLRLLSVFEELEDAFDLVLIDTGAGVGDTVMFFAGAAQEVLLVVSPEPTALTDAYTAVKLLSQRAGVGHFNVVVNQAESDAAGRSIFATLTLVTSRFLQARVSYLGHLPTDTHVHLAVMAQQPMVELYPQSPCSLALRDLGDTLLNEPAPPFLDGGLKILWRRLFRETGEQR
jgi:flagellar biosynthesis protein FlhG